MYKAVFHMPDFTDLETSWKCKTLSAGMHASNQAEGAQALRSEKRELFSPALEADSGKSQQKDG